MLLLSVHVTNFNSVFVDWCKEQRFPVTIQLSVLSSKIVRVTEY